VTEVLVELDKWRLIELEGAHKGRDEYPATQMVICSGFDQAVMHDA
jgi:hypothetical protein